MDVKETPYAAWLEGFIRAVMELRPTNIGIVMLLEDGRVSTAYFGGDCTHNCKAIMGYQMYIDSLMDVVKANAKQILEAAGEAGPEE